MMEQITSRVTLHSGDCLDILPTLAECSIDSCVTDPPYGLSFMGRNWDHGVPGAPFWREVYRVLKPGAHLVAFGGSRTYHRMACAIEDAGFEIRDSLMWIYGTGFPKSHDVSKGIDKKRDDSADIEHVRIWLEQQRQRVGITRKAVNDALGLADNGGGLMSAWTTNQTTRAVPQWDQWLQLKALLGFSDDMDAEVMRLNDRKGEYGEAWKTAEVIGRGRSAIANTAEKDRYTVGASKAVDFDLKAANSEAAREWEGWGTALKPAFEPIVLARKPLSESTVTANVLRWRTGALNIDGCRIGTEGGTAKGSKPQGAGHGIYGAGLHGACEIVELDKGRWPANVCHDGSDEVVAAFPNSNGQNGSVSGGEPSSLTKNVFSARNRVAFGNRNDTGSAARFFYSAKASKADRAGSKHPTVKPVSLMQWLCRLITPPGGTILDPFAGSGTTGAAARNKGFNCILIEREAEYQQDIRNRFASSADLLEAAE
jgi:DNA modification methylase